MLTKVKLRSFSKGELVLLARSPLDPTRRKEDKFASKWDGLFAIKKAYPNGAYLLRDVEGNQIFPVINAKFLNKITLMMVLKELRQFDPVIDRYVGSSSFYLPWMQPHSTKKISLNQSY